MSAGAILAVDQGTTSVRASVLDGSLRVIATSSETVRRDLPRPGWVDLDAVAVVAATERVAARALAQAGKTTRDLVGFGLANQGETALVWDRKTGAPIAPAIVWQCRRTERECALLRAQGVEPWVKSRTGLPLDAYFSASKIAWLLDHTPGARAAAERGDLLAGTLDTFTLYSLSGGKIFATDPSTSCRTLLARLDSGLFDEELCKLFRVPRAMLAEVVSSDARSQTDLGDIAIAGGRVPLRALLCDQPSALLGVGCLARGSAKCTYGTGAFVQVNTASDHEADAPGLLRSIAWQLGDQRTYLLEGSILSAGDVLTWLRDEMQMLVGFDEVDGMLRAGGNGGVTFVPALTGLGAPSWLGDARGTIFGLSRATRREHLVRAALEGVAHQVADVLDVADAFCGRRLDPLWVDGGLAASDAFVELQADLSGRTMRRLPSNEATTRGIGAVVATRAGLADSLDALVGGQASVSFSPTMQAEDRLLARARYHQVLALATRPEILALTSNGSEPGAGGA